MQAWAALLAGLVSPADPCQASWPCFRPLLYLDELLGAGVQLHGQLGLQSGEPCSGEKELTSSHCIKAYPSCAGRKRCIIWSLCCTMQESCDKRVWSRLQHKVAPRMAQRPRVHFGYRLGPSWCKCLSSQVNAAHLF